MIRKVLSCLLPAFAVVALCTSTWAKDCGSCGGGCEGGCEGGAVVAGDACGGCEGAGAACGGTKTVYQRQYVTEMKTVTSTEYTTETRFVTV